MIENQPSRARALTRLASEHGHSGGLRPFVWRLVSGVDLGRADAAKFMRMLFHTAHTDAEQIIAALVALSAKGETAAELAGMTETILERAALFCTTKKKFIDIGGTGMSAAKTFNVSTAAAFVVAGAGLAVANQSHPRVLSFTGSRDVLDKLGIQLNQENKTESIQNAEASFNGAGIGFLAASVFHEQEQISVIRRRLDFSTTFNMLDILANPARPPFRVIGVWHSSLLVPVAEALALLGVERAWVVNGADGLDEITLATETMVAEVADGKVECFLIQPEDFGVKSAPLDALRAESATNSAAIIKSVLEGKRRDAARSTVIINAAAALYVGGVTRSLTQAVRLAELSIDSDAARMKLERAISATNGAPNIIPPSGAANSILDNI